jgi:ABC-type transport system involved in multi-copper enzyme maturation permease subunit
MMANLRSEVRKLLTMRWTYYILAFTFVLLIFFGFYISGWHIDKGALHDPTTLATDVTSAISTLGVFVALIAVLLFANEYRYNTIMYTLTSSNSRTKVLASKIIVITGFALIFGLIFGVLSPVVSLLGIHIHHLKLVHQTLDYGNLLWRSLFYMWGYAMAGLIIAALTRNQVGSIIILFVAPATVEGLLGLALKSNVVYLPFSSLDTVIGQGMNYHNSITPAHAALVFTSYLVVSLGAAWYLFLHRDAN